MKNSILSVYYLLGSVFLVCLFLDGNIAQLIAPNMTDSTSGGAANVTSGGIVGNTSGGVANVTSGGIAGNTSGGAANVTPGGIAGNTSAGAANVTSGGIAGNTSAGAANVTSGGIAGNTSGGAANVTSGSIAGNTSGGAANVTSGSIAGKTSAGTAKETSGGIAGNTSVRSASTSKGTANDAVGQTASNSVVGTISGQSGTGGQPTGTSHSADSLVGSAVNVTSGKASGDPSRVATNSSDGTASNSPGGFTSNTSRETPSNTIAVSESTRQNSSGPAGASTTPISSSNASRDSTTNAVNSSARATSTVGGSVDNSSTAKPLVQSSGKKPGKSSGGVAGTNSQSAKKPLVDSTVWPFDVSTEAITTEIPAPPPLEETDPNKKIKEKKPSPSLGPSLSPDGKPCNESYRPHETDKSKYMQLESDGIWQKRECSPDGNLVWIQELCECGFDKTAENMIYEDACPSYKPDPKNKHGYLWQVHGVFVPMPCIESLVWSQKDCMCTWDESPKSDRSALANQKVVCQRILELKMDNDLTNSAARYEVKANSASGRGGISKIRFIHTIGATDNAAEIQNQPLTLDAFKGNDFQKAITFTLNFKILRSRAQSRTPMVLLTNGCIPDHTTLIRAPSINLSFTPGTNTFRVQFNTTETAIDETAVAEPDQNGWFKTVLYFQDQTVTLEVNGKKILSTNGMLGTIPKNLCPLLIGGSDIERNQNFYGYLDNVNIIKDCKFHEANIKLL